MNETFKSIRNKALEMVDYKLQTEGSDHVVMYREHLDMVNEKFGEMIVRQCVFEMVHESTNYRDKQLYDFTVDVTKRITERFGIE